MNLLRTRSWRRAACFASVPLLATFISSAVAAQLDGRFSLSKEKYLAGEPVFLSFTVKNAGNQPVRIRTADPLSFCGGYGFKVAGVRDREALPCGRSGFGGSCASSDVVLAPGESRTDRILLNARFDLRLPGNYSLQVKHRVVYGGADETLAALASGKVFQDFETEQQILIASGTEDEIQPEYAQYARVLDSADFHTKLEAARVVAYLAPKFMEPTILKMLGTPALQIYGVEGLRSLGTSSAHRALAEYIKNAPPTNVLGPYQTALRYIGEIGDEGDIPLLIEVALANAPDSSSREIAIESAGKLGGAAAIPALSAELADPSIDTRQAAVRALYLTGSRAAVPVLIGLLQSPEWRVSLTAEYGLEVLTHRSGATTTSMKPPPPDTYSKWMHWWKEHGETATIFKTDLCGKAAPLPSL